ncbi:CCR4-NOT transcription complex subunit 7/8/Pop2 like protein [Aduncisulcus paluster]|uniref:poly(A)-specific ribonuclease n=1 Tax=Aduncisulcus paluster TaxID=2918883 RepID=A0ABQ5KFL9_9EUKA|nr:CCR4-NOT transcription complex subunit 7/8/Pop2 like protein [Aduncisulcus paluster]
MDTEFPGCIVEGGFTPETRYGVFKQNVDQLSLIQIGLTLSDEKANFPHPCTFQFNFKFDISKELHSKASIDLLKESGIDFTRLKTDGIDPLLFASKMAISGLAYSKDVAWVAFHSSYDFGYLVKLLTNHSLPVLESDFNRLLSICFPNIYDVKFIQRRRTGNQWHGGLERLAKEFRIGRFGTAHQAGSDSLLTLECFWYLYRFQAPGPKIDGVDRSTTPSTILPPEKKVSSLQITPAATSTKLVGGSHASSRASSTTKITAPNPNGSSQAVDVKGKKQIVSIQDKRGKIVATSESLSSSPGMPIDEVSKYFARPSIWDQTSGKWGLEADSFEREYCSVVYGLSVANDYS